MLSLDFVEFIAPALQGHKYIHLSQFPQDFVHSSRALCVVPEGGIEFDVASILLSFQLLDTEHLRILHQLLHNILPNESHLLPIHDKGPTAALWES